MKIVCDNCSTKYSIADEKVRGKVFKIKCKKCSHIIVVKGAEGAEGAPPQGFDQKETRVFDYSGFEGDPNQAGAAASPGAGDPVWHLVIDREQVGPLSVAEVAQKLQAGEIDADTYGWREGFGDWLRLGAIDELAAVVSGGGAAPAAAGGLFGGGGAHAAPAAKADPTDLFGGAPTDDEPASDLFGGGGAAHSPALAAAGDGGVFASAPMAARRGGDDLFGGGGGAEMDHSGGGGGRVEVKSMTGQRNENSVLFSLNNLASLATETPKSSGGGGMGGGANPAFTSGGGTDGSGLIDIRAMAAMTLGTKSGAGPSHSAGSVDDLPVFSPSAFSAPSAGILLPTMNTQSAQNKKIYILMGVLGVLALTAIILVVVVLTSKPAEVIVQAPPTAADPAAPDQANTAPTPGSMAAPAVPPSTPPQAATPTPSAPVAAATPSSSRDEKPKSSRDTKRDDKRSDKPSSKPERAEKPEPEEKPEPLPKSSGTKCDEVACLVDSSLPCCKGSRSSSSSRPAASASSGSQEKLERADIVTGIGTVRGRVMACNDQYKVPGTVSVKIIIENSGSVGSATVQGKFAGTPTGDCVEKAVSKARFKKFGGPSVPVTYPFAFR